MDTSPITDMRSGIKLGQAFALIVGIVPLDPPESLPLKARLLARCDGDAVAGFEMGIAMLAAAAHAAQAARTQQQPRGDVPKAFYDAEI